MTGRNIDTRVAGKTGDRAAEWRRGMTVKEMTGHMERDEETNCEKATLQTVR